MGKIHYGYVISLLHDGVKANASTWFQIIHYTYVNIINIIFDL